MRFAFNFIAASLCVVVLSGCGSMDGTTPAPTSGNGALGSSTNVTVAVAATSATTVDAGQTVALSATLTGDTGNKGVTWTVSAGGGSLASSTGLTNTYTAPATAVSSVTITATSVLDPTKYASTSVAVNPLPAFTSTGQLPAAYAGVAYNTALSATGGTGVRTYAIASGTLPAGLSLNAATGVISGTPAASGSSTFSIAVKDSASTPVTSTASFALGVSALQMVPPALTATVVGRAYTAATYSAAFAQGTVTYSITAGSLPAGLALSSTGVVSGTATAAGDSSFTVTATDAAGQTASATGAIHVASGMQLSGAALATTQAGTAFAGYTVAATGGTAPYTYSLAAGSALPQGVTLSAGGVLAGTPADPGSYTFNVIAKDSNGAVTTSSQSVTATFNLSVTVPPLTFVTATLDNAVVGSPYAQRIAATGGVTPYTFSLVSGSLPAGMFLSSTGQFVGRSSAAGTYTLTVQVTDSEGSAQTVSQVFPLTVASTLTPQTNNTMLNGQYAFVFHGVSNGALAPGAAASGSVFGADMAGSLTFDGTSLVTGTVDLNGWRNGFQGAVAVTGSYAVGDDRRGQVVLNYGGNTITLDVALSGLNGGVASKFRFIEADADNANNVDQVQGTGEALKQTPSAFTTASLTGSYVFRLNGETPSAAVTSAAALGTALPQFGALSAAGYFQMNGAGLIARGSLDASSFNTAYPLVSLLGSYTAPDSSGRGTLVMNTVGTSYPLAPIHFVYYVISAKQIVLLSQDSHLSTSLMAGMAYQQQQALYTAASLSGTVIAAESGVLGGNGTNTFPGSLAATFYVLKVTGVGTMSGYSADNTAGVTHTFESSPDPVQYTVSDAGRVTLVDLTQPGAQLPVFWLYDVNAGVGTELNSSAGTIGTLALQGQTPGTFSTASINGTYATGLAPVALPAVFAGGVLNATAGAGAPLTQDATADGTLTPDTTVQLTKAVAAGTGRFTLTGNGVFYNGYVLSPDKLVFFDATSGFTRPVIWVAEK